ncbi:MAG: hypothetical protein K2I43_07295, partial [Alistipes sp.]|nr:hypothetical protein [Alistipes sp.]
NDYVRTTFAPDVRPTLGELVFWPVTAAVTLEAGDRMVFTVVTDAHEIVKTVTLSRELAYTVASLNKASVGLAGAEVRTRDMVTDLSAGGTANSYAVGRAAAKYKFRADVKGNGRALDCGTLSYGEDDLRIEPKGALVLWYTCVQTACTPWEQRSPIVLDAVSCKDGYIYFETPEEFVNGNVVIVALDKALAYDEVESDAENRIANAEVLWSWNIIASEGYDIDAPENCIVKGGYTIMGRDLGAVLDYSDVYKGSWAATNHFEMASVGGNFYQWGRKDPFPTFPDYESLAAGGYTGLRFTPTYTPIPALNRGSFGLTSPNRQASDQIFGTDNGTVAISYTGSADSEFAAQAVQNPHLWLYKGNCWNKYMSFWGNPTAGTERKTIYDPCPPGWKIWSKNAWLALTDGQTAEFVTTDRGLMLDGKWYFPLCGARSSWGEVMGYHGPCGVKIPAQYVVSDAEYSNWACHVAVEAEVNFQPGSTNVTYTTTGNWIGTNNYTDRGARVRCIRDDE